MYSRVVSTLYMVMMILITLPLIIPVELYCRIKAPEHRWSRYPAFHEVYNTRFARTNSDREP